MAGANDAFEDVLERVREAGRGGDPVDLVVARESGLLLTAGEFRSLRQEIDRDRLALTLRCDDALRDGLARAMGIQRRRIPPELRDLLDAPAAETPADAASASPADPHLAFRRPGQAAAPAANAPAAEPAPAAAPRRAPVAPTSDGSSGSPPVGDGAETRPASRSTAGPVPAPGAANAAAATGARSVAGPTNDRPGSGAVIVPAAEGGGPEAVAAPRFGATAGAPDSGRGAAAPVGGVGPNGAEPPRGGGSWPEQPGPPATPEPAPTGQRRRPGARFRRRRGELHPGEASVGPESLAAAGTTALPEHAAPTPDGTVQAAGEAGERPVDGPSEPTFEQIVAPRYRRARRPGWFGVVVGVVALAVLVALAGALLMPRATVAVTLRSAPVAGEAAVDVTASGQPLDDGAALALAATPVEVTVTYSGSVPASGVRAEPDATAAGAVRFANPQPEAVTVPAGTEMTTGAGTVFVTTADVTVPGTDPATGQSGQTDGAIRAVQPGTDGNVDVGEIGGRLDSGVYYSNRDAATAGGTDRQVPVVAVTDLDALRSQADAALGEEATKAVRQQLGDGVQLLPGSTSVAANDESFSAKEGDAVGAVTLKTTRTVRALAWSPEAAQDELRGILAGPPAAFLAGQAPAGWIVDPVSVQFGDPAVEGGSPQGARVRLPVKVLTTPRFGPDERRALAERLAGLDEASAASVLAAEPALAAAEVEFRPGWFLRRLPADPDRIAIEVSG